ncbi:MAG: group 1 truncated hemoglobin [Verrucomicrobiales bacterium]|nr:group 1 truncated hemoglobin [Verrucomicrobiales bacterium]
MKKIKELTLLAVLSVWAVSSLSSFAQDKKVDPESIYARLGGQVAIDAAVDIFYKKVLADDSVNYFFEDISMKAQIRKQKEFLGAVFGGPVAWQGKNMREAHKNLDISEEEFAAIAGHLSSTLKDLKVASDLHDEIMTLVGSTKDDVLNREKTPAKE